jgi:MinD-like ATPase involved in chromosome partitioning or flagellar assembly
LIIDTGCGVTPWTKRFWVRSQVVLLVTSTDDLALLDAYMALKLSAADGIDADVRLLANRCDNDAIAADVYRRFATACGRFLSRRADSLSPLPTHMTDGMAGAPSAPRVWESPNTPFGHAALWLGRAVGDLLASVLRPVDPSLSLRNRCKTLSCR